MVKKLGNYLRSNICVVILWCVVTALTVFGAWSDASRFIPDEVFAIILVFATAMVVIDFVRFEHKQYGASGKYGVKVLYKPKSKIGR